MNFIDIINPYYYAMRLRRLLYKKAVLKSYNVSVPVISIGNLSMGGTGKTPVTLATSRYCRETLQKKTAILLRGYKRKSSGLLVVSNGKDILENVSKSGDEAQLYARESPATIVICDEDRIRGAEHAITLGAEVILLDDAYQHLRIKRELNLLLINSDEGIPAMFPFGKGREDITAMSDADIIILTNYSQNSGYSIPFTDKPQVYVRTILSAIHLYFGNEESDISPEYFHGKRLLAVSGIANADRFEQSLADYSAEEIPYRLADHAEYDNTILDNIVAQFRKENCDFIATTTKDAVKMLQPFIQMQRQDQAIPPLAVIHTDIEFIHGGELLFNSINDLFKTKL